jgi:hypothetical protein
VDVDRDVGCRVDVGLGVDGGGTPRTSTLTATSTRHVHVAVAVAVNAHAHAHDAVNVHVSAHATSTRASTHVNADDHAHVNVGDHAEVNAPAAARWRRPRPGAILRAMKSTLALAATLALLAVPACKKDAAPAPAPAAAPAGPAGTAAAPRKVAIDVGQEGYKPDRIVGKAGEALVLVFTRTFDAECIGQVKVPGGKLVDLPMGKPVEVALTVPASGEVGFACGMDMFHGVVVAQPAS